MAHDAPGGSAEHGPASLSECEKRQQQLDDALADSFPASDPVSFITSQGEDPFDPTTPCDPADTGERDLSGVKRPAS